MSAETTFELRITLADGTTVVGAVPSGHDWLAEHAGQTLGVRRDTTWTTSGHALPTVVPIEVEGHLIALQLPSAADAEVLRRALAIGALSATLAVGGIIGFRTAPSTASADTGRAAATMPTAHARSAELPLGALR